MGSPVRVSRLGRVADWPVRTVSPEFEVRFCLWFRYRKGWAVSEHGPGLLPGVAGRRPAGGSLVT